MKKFFITTPIYYVNDVPHLGHLYTTLAGDILARHYRLTGREVYFLTGTDEHGSKIAEAAEKHNQSPQAFVDNISEQFKQVWQKYDITFDRFIRTTEEEHVKVVQQFLTDLQARGYIYKGEYSGLYCRGCEEYKKTSDLVDGLCPVHQRAPESLAEPAYFFKLSAFADQISSLIDSRQLEIQPESRRNEVLSFLSSGLEDVAISRQNVEWGIPLPWDQSHTIYVWIDALINYYTAGLKVDCWPADWHLMSKDILRFHCVIWPAMLLALELDLPKSIFIHGYFTVDGQKMSKSLGNVVNPLEMLQKYDRDVIRVFLFKSFPFGADGDFSWELLDRFYNGQLANELGNLVQRVLVMADKYCDGIVPKGGGSVLSELTLDFVQNTRKDIEKLAFGDALNHIFSLIQLANRHIDNIKLWDKSNEQAFINQGIAELIELIRHLSIALLPIMPDTAHKIAHSLNFDLKNSYTKDEYETIIRWGNYLEGRKIVVPEVLFPRRGES